VSQASIPAGEQSGLLMHIAMTESDSGVRAEEQLSAFIELESAIHADERESLKTSRNLTAALVACCFTNDSNTKPNFARSSSNHYSTGSGITAFQSCTARKNLAKTLSFRNSTDWAA
jgi:hypothetical protein